MAPSSDPSWRAGWAVFVRVAVAGAVMAAWACSASRSGAPDGSTDGSVPLLDSGFDVGQADSVNDATTHDATTDSSSSDAAPGHDGGAADSGLDATTRLDSGPEASPDAGESGADAADASGDAASAGDAGPACPVNDAGANDAGANDAAAPLCQAAVLGSNSGSAFFNTNGHVVAVQADPVLDPGVAVYWMGGNDCVAQTSLTGGGTGRLGAGVCNSNSTTSAVTADSTSVYYLDPRQMTLLDCNLGGTGVWKVSRADGSTSNLVCVSQVYGGGYMAVDATSVYWGGAGGVWKVPVDGGTAVQLSGGGAGGVVIDATSAYWTDGTSVMSVPLTGGTVLTLASGQSGARGIRVDATSVYWLATGVGAVMKVPRVGGTPTVLAPCQSGLTGIGLDANYVYWSTTNASNDVAVFRVPLAGGQPALLASGFVDPNTVYSSNLATDGAGNVYLVAIVHSPFFTFDWPGYVWQVQCAASDAGG